jgi:Zn-dependent metalloprotease
MKKGTNYGSAVNFTDSDNNWTATEFNNVNKDNALDAHWGAKTYDYFSAVHGRNSYDNLGAIKVTCIMTLL